MTAMKERKLLIKLVFAVLFLSLVCSCGYQLVRDKGIFGGEIASIYLPIFKNNTYEPNLSQHVTDAFSKELLSTALFKVNNKEADGYIQGTITDATFIPVTLSSDGLAVQKNVNITVDLALYKKNGAFVKRWALSDAETYSVTNIDYEEYNKSDAIKRLSARMARRFSALLMVDY